MPGSTEAERSAAPRSYAPGVPAGPPSGVGVSETRRARILTVAVALVGEVGYARMTVERVVGLAGISQETFHKCFEDLDDCLLAAFEDALGRIAAVVGGAYEGEREWPARVRAALAALLALIEDEPAVSTFVFVGALGAGPKVLACRMQALERLKLAFEHGIDGMGRVAGSEIGESSALDGREISECSPLTAEGAVNAVLGILHTRLLEGSPLARRPLSELAGPLTAMVVLPYVGHVAASNELAPGRSRSSKGPSNGAGALAATIVSNGAGGPGSKVRPKAGARKRKRARLTTKQRKLVAALKDGPLTVRELVDATGLSDQTARQSLNRLEAREKVSKTERDGRIAYKLPPKRGAAAGPKVAAGSSSSNGAAASNGHNRSAVTKAMLQGLDPQVSKRELEVLAAIDQLNVGGSSPSNREIGNATQIYDPTQLSRLLQRLAHLWLVQNNATGRKSYGWRLTTKGTELLRELEAQLEG